MKPMNSSLARSYSFCETLARREAGNFYNGFRVLPRGQRLAMCALYAFMRIADDLSDEPGNIDDKRRQLAGWRAGLTAASAGQFSHPIHEALHHTVHAFNVPLRYLEDVIDGVEMDLEPVAFDSFADLRVYCYRVASAVGLACIHVWGFKDERARDHAESSGIAFQLTNILRDLGEDASRGRVYLPRDELARFGYDAAGLSQGVRDGRFRELMRFQVERARDFYRQARPLATLLPPPGRAVFLVLSRTYAALLDAIEQRDYDVFSSRVSVSRWKKLFYVVRALPVRWGLVHG
ncbi:MAG: squalene/phytoene synthase family protein [Planctomycetes bacterium]|nr:squalene/phytoene synthase family protein [Planctomycetota bacterium]